MGENKQTISAVAVELNALRITSVRFQHCHHLVWTTKPLQKMAEAFGLILGAIRAMLTIRDNSASRKKMGLGPKVDSGQLQNLARLLDTSGSTKAVAVANRVR